MSVRGCVLCQAPAATPCPGCDAFACSPDHLSAHRPGPSCQPFRILSSPSVGRHMVATATIAPYQTILVERAVVVGPKLCSPVVCLECLAAVIHQVVPCTRCQVPFCSEGCRRRRERHGEEECRVLARAGLSLADLEPSNGVLGAVTVLRMLLLPKKR